MKLIYNMTGIALLFLFFLSSCQQNNLNVKTINTIDSTLTSLEHVKVKLNEIDIRQADSTIAEIKDLADKLMVFYTAEDTASYWRNEVSDLHFCIKTVERYLTENPGISRELDYTIDQLKTLRHDIENNLIDEKQLEKHLNVEIQAARLILTKSAKRGGRALECLENKEEIIAKADSLYKVLDKEIE